jgi:hypothetical protein
MEKNFEIIRNMFQDRLAETLVLALLFLSGIILIFAGKNWAWGCYVLAALDLTVFIVLFIGVSKAVYDETVERIIRETVQRIEKSEAQ